MLHSSSSLRWICAVKIAGWEEPETAYEPASLDSWQLRPVSGIDAKSEHRHVCILLPHHSVLKWILLRFTTTLTLPNMCSFHCLIDHWNYGIWVLHRFEFPLPNFIGGSGVAFLLALELRVRMGPEFAADVHLLSRWRKTCQQSAQLSQWRRVASCNANLEKIVVMDSLWFTSFKQFQGSN